jgi:hypothetical protein
LLLVPVPRRLGREQVVEEIGGKRGLSRQSGLAVDRLRLLPHGGIRGRAQRGDFLVAQPLEDEQTDFPFGRRHAPRLELLVHRALEPGQMRLHLAAPTIAFGPGDLQVADERHLLFVLRMDALDQEGDTHRRTDRQGNADGVADEIEQGDLVLLGQELDRQQQGEAADAHAAQ